MSDASADWDTQQITRQASFLQSSLWGSFQESVGHAPHYLMEEDWSCLLIDRKTHLGKYLFAPYGPTLSSIKSLSDATDSLKSYARSAGYDWLRLEPRSKAIDAQTLEQALSRSGAGPATRKVNPDLTRILDLKLPPEAMLAAISQSTRSFIRKNQREQFLSFTSSSNPDDIHIFVNMLGLVAKRNRVNFYSPDYFRKQARLLMPAGMLRLELALEDGRPVASALIHDFGQVSSYTYAGSLPQARQTSASALLLWQVMLNAKKRGMEKMDLFGIAPDNAPATHPWQGFSSFKKKFGGDVVEFAGTWDIPLSSKYRLYRRLQKTRSILRRR